MRQSSVERVDTFTELWEAAYRAGYADALLERACDPDSCMPDELPIAHLPYGVSTDLRSSSP